MQIANFMIPAWARLSVISIAHETSREGQVKPTEQRKLFPLLAHQENA
jgi:hypothetical protein